MIIVQSLKKNNKKLEKTDRRLLEVVTQDNCCKDGGSNPHHQTKTHALNVTIAIAGSWTDFCCFLSAKEQVNGTSPSQSLLEQENTKWLPNTQSGGLNESLICATAVILLWFWSTDKPIYIKNEPEYSFPLCSMWDHVLWSSAIALFQEDIIIEKRHRGFPQKGYFNFLIHTKANQTETWKYELFILLGKCNTHCLVWIEHIAETIVQFIKRAIVIFKCMDNQGACHLLRPDWVNTLHSLSKLKAQDLVGSFQLSWVLVDHSQSLC